jgi:hypothetical protein
MQEVWNREDSSPSILGESLSPHDVRDFTVIRIRMPRWLPALIAIAPTGNSRRVRSTDAVVQSFGMRKRMDGTWVHRYLCARPGNRCQQLPE